MAKLNEQPDPKEKDTAPLGQAKGASEAQTDRETTRETVSATPPSQLTLSNVHKTYPGGHRALNGVDLDVVRGEVVVIIGPSGCGKSTLLRTINGLERIDNGDIALDGQSLLSPAIRWHDIRQRIGMVFQSYELFPHLDVLANVTLAPRKVQGISKEEAEKRAQALLERVGLGDRAHAFPRQLSGGQKQRVAIVRALVMKPEVLLLDEVTASLDPEMVREVLDVVVELAREGMTMLIVTHEMAFARAIADRIVFMDHGKIVESAPPEEFFTAPRSERARQFLDIFRFEDAHEGAGHHSV